jgi:hypothetical protein
MLNKEYLEGTQLSSLVEHTESCYRRLNNERLKFQDYMNEMRKRFKAMSEDELNYFRFEFPVTLKKCRLLASALTYELNKKKASRNAKDFSYAVKAETRKATRIVVDFYKDIYNDHIKKKKKEEKVEEKSE